MTILIVFLTALYASAQNDLSLSSIDLLSYNYLMNKDYITLRKLGKQSLKQGIDFYYLRLRLGISYYKQNKYEQSYIHFKKANDMYSQDSILQEYLYFSMLYTDRNLKAYRYAQQFPQKLKDKIQYKTFSVFNLSNLFNEINISASVITNDNNNYDYKKLFNDSTMFYNELMLQKEIYTSSIFIKSQITPNIQLSNKFVYCRTAATGIVQVKDSSVVSNFSQYPFQYNFGLNYSLSNGLSIFGSLGLYREISKIQEADYDSVINKYSFKQVSYNKLAKSVSLNVSYKFLYASLGYSFSVANLSSTRQMQNDLNVLIYPLGNKNLYLYTNFSLLRSKKENNYIFEQKIGFSINKNIWLNADFSYGNMKNYLKLNGFETYNSIDPIKFHAGLSLSFYFKHIEIEPYYGFQIRENKYFYVDKLKNETTNSYRYNNNLFNLMVRWKF